MPQNLRRLRQIRCFLLDMDGTFYLGERLLPGALEFIQYLEEQGLSYLFLTNNSSRSKREYAAKLSRLGLELPEEKIFTSGEATAIYLRKQKPGARLYVVGTPALEDEFVRFGFQLVDQNPDFLVLGFDTSLTYTKIVRLCDFLVAGAPYIATHPDVNCPTEHGFIPDIGSMIEMMAASTGRRPDVIIGKPNPPIVHALVEKTGIPVREMCMVGDRLYTDIALGQTGLTTVLVMSGETHAEDLPQSPFKPDLVMRDLAELLQSLRAETAD
jgi:HAD superfamily hydrolase (TIGR01457 family)